MTDAIVVGSGPNGLVAANLLADAGWAVLVLEAQPEPGGAVRSAEIAAPGFVADRFSSFHPLAVVAPALRALRLEEHGLVWARAEVALAHSQGGGRAAFVGASVDETAAALDAAAPGDGDGWRTLLARWHEVGGAFLDTVLRPFPPLGPAARVAATLGPRGTLDFTRFALLSVRRLAAEHFAGEGGALLLAGNAAHTDLTLDAAGSATFGWLLSSLAQTVGYPTPVGGAGTLTAALARRLESRGGRVHCDARVTEIVVKEGRAVAVVLADGTEIEAPRAVLADVSAPALYRDLVGAAHLPAGYLRRYDRFQWDHATLKVDWALRRPVPWLAEAVRRSAVVHVADSMAELGTALGQIESGYVPDRPFLVVGQPDVADPTRCPPGYGTLWAYTHVPQHVRGDVGGEITGAWDARDVDALVERIEHRIEAHAPGFRALVVGRHVMSPRDLEAADANLVGGAINGGTAALHQQFVFRPTLGRAGPRTPIRNLYLASASAHPGGGVHGACGAHAARAAIATHARRRVASAFTRRP